MDYIKSIYVKGNVIDKIKRDGIRIERSPHSTEGLLHLYIQDISWNQEEDDTILHLYIQPLYPIHFKDGS